MGVTGEGRSEVMTTNFRLTSVKVSGIVMQLLYIAAHGNSNNQLVFGSCVSIAHRISRLVLIARHVKECK